MKGTSPRHQWKRLFVSLATIWTIATLTLAVGESFPFISALYLVAVFGLTCTFINIELKIHKSLKNDLLVGIYCGILVIAFIKSIHTIIYAYPISVSDLVNFSSPIWMVIFIGLIGAHGVHFNLYYLRNSLVSTDIKSRLIFYTGLILPLIFVFGSEPFSLLVILLAYGAYALLLDMFCDTHYKSNVMWLITWTIVLGSLLALNINSALFDKSNPIPMVNAISVFSGSFILSAGLYVLYAIINQRLNFLPEEFYFKIPKSYQLHSKIQLAIMATLLFSFTAIGLVSIYQLRAQLSVGSDQVIRQLSLALLNTYTFLFLVGFSIAYILAKYIRTPLLELGKTLNNVKLNQKNEKILWHGDDEIAGLIHQYNGMIAKLEENTLLLTQIERDNAWREMAKQVAHEIKNPLTPMKLSLQYLEKSINHNREDIGSLALRMCDTLKSQVDNLQQIADTFATFGSLPKTINDKLNLNQVVETIHDLFRNREDMEIQLVEPIDDIDVYADKNQLLRVLNNLVKNSIQAIPEGRKGIIELRLWKDGNKAIIQVKDNGCGISKDEQKLIFKPRFTTKTSGSGLGLAISANIIDSMGGTIYFDSEPNLGCSFFVELPLIRYEFNTQSNRVLLED